MQSNHGERAGHAIVNSMRSVPILLLICWSVLGEEPKNLKLFLLIGQSNMAGRGEAGDADRQPIPGIWVQAQDLSWKPAVAPLHYDKPAIAGVGLGRSFAQAVAAAHPGVSIGLIPAAFGGSALDEWKPGSTHYTEAIRRTRAALRNGALAGILWHQGEADSGSETLAKSYAERFQAFIQQLRTDLAAAQIPVVVGELGRFFHDRPSGGAKYAAVVVEQLRLIPDRVPQSAFVSAEKLTDKGDLTHFDTRSLHELGRRYAAAYLKLESR